jgi:hypothetical protein
MNEISLQRKEISRFFFFVFEIMPLHERFVLYLKDPMVDNI